MADPEAVYQYDLDDTVIYEVVRYPDKVFRQRRPANGGHVWNLDDIERVPYRHGWIERAGNNGETLWIVEGEKDADRLIALGLNATTSAGGANWPWPDDWSKHFVGVPQAVIVADNDPPGLAAALQRAAIVAQAVPDVRILEQLPGVGDHGDVSDWLDQGGTLPQLLELADRAPQWQPPPLLNGHTPDPGEHAERQPPRDTAKPGPNVDDFLNEPEPEYDWVIPGIAERGDRIILTGVEGGGKSTLYRQMAVQCAAGIHPFTLHDIPPVRVLLIDLENSKRQVRRKLRPIRQSAPELDPNNLTIKVAAQGLDLLQQDDRDRLERVIEANRPDIIFIGPLYKMAGGDPTDERVAKAVATCLDELRGRHQFVIFIEAHSPHSANNQKRPERPYGASLWIRWPEFGLHVTEQGQLRHWRGPRDEREWPAVLKRGGEWPWTADTSPKVQTFARILEEIERAGGPLSYRALADLVGSNKSQVKRAIDANLKQYEEACRKLGHEGPVKDLSDDALFADE